MRRLAAIAALVLLAAAAALVVITAVQSFPRGLIVAAALVLAPVAGWQAVRRRGAARASLLGLAVVLLVGAIVVLIAGEVLLEAVIAIGCFLAALACAKRAFAVHVRLPPAPAPKRAVVIWNPKSGGGKATRDHLADEARARGIEPIELKPGDDIVQLARDAIASGADALAAAGGDGTQALIATIAAEHDLPFACIPAGTRNHFALDLGVDRDDVVGALDAFVSGGERRVDLAEVNGRVFVNNVSLGIYAEAVQRQGYRDAKLRTILDTAPDVAGVEPSESRELTWSAPGEPAGGSSAAVILVSNNPYRLGRPLGSGTRPRMDGGTLGVAVMGSGAAGGPSWRQWAAPEFEVGSSDPVPVGVDGEALVLDPPLRFASRPGALRVRIAPQHPGASPSAAMPDGLADAIRAGLRVAGGADPADAVAPRA